MKKINYLLIILFNYGCCNNCDIDSRIYIKKADGLFSGIVKFKPFPKVTEEYYVDSGLIDSVEYYGETVDEPYRARYFVIDRGTNFICYGSVREYWPYYNGHVSSNFIIRYLADSASEFKKTIKKNSSKIRKLLTKYERLIVYQSHNAFRHLDTNCVIRIYNMSEIDSILEK